MNIFHQTLTLIFLLISRIISGNSGFAESKKDMLKVLFTGNSYTDGQNSSQFASIISDSAKTKLATRKSTGQGAFLSEHWFGKRIITPGNL